MTVATAGPRAGFPRTSCWPSGAPPDAYQRRAGLAVGAAAREAVAAGFAVGGASLTSVGAAFASVGAAFASVGAAFASVGVGLATTGVAFAATVAAGFVGTDLAAAVADCLSAGFGTTLTAVGVGVGGIPASERGRSRTTASSVGSGVGWLIASTSAFCERGAPPPHAAHTVATTRISRNARTRLQLRTQGLPSC